MAPKKQTQKMSLGDFLGDQSLGSWADEMEDMPVSQSSRPSYGGGDRRAFSSAPSFGSGDRGSDRTAELRDRGFATRPQLPLPSKPPYTAHLGNLPFDATGVDIEEFFAGCEVSNVRIVEDKLERKPKGFGYVEFRTLDGLKKALDLSGTPFHGRDIRISVADPPKDRPEARELNDWTRKGPLPDLPQQQRRVSERGGFGSSFEPAPMERGGSRRGANFGPPGDGKERDFSNWERKGPLSPIPNAAPQGREGGRSRAAEPRERKLSPSWGEGRSQDGSRPPKREFAARPAADRQPTAAEMDNQWRARMKPDAPADSSSTPTPEPSAPTSPAAQSAVPATRPRLNLAKRTVSEAPNEAPAASSDSKASPFGAARPIDTAAREREVAEKRELAIRQKREAEEKAREEKKAREAAAKAEAGENEEAGDETKADGEKKENGESARPSYQILSRLNDDGEEGEKEEEDENANGKIVEDKAVKPREFVREPPKGPRADRRQGAGDTWRRKSSNTNTPTSPKPGNTGEALEEDGWSTVPSKQRGGRGRGGARAIAS